MFDLDSWKNQTIAEELIKATVTLIDIIKFPITTENMIVNVFNNEIPTHNESIENLILNSYENDLLSDYQLRENFGQLLKKDFTQIQNSKLNAYNVIITSKCLANNYTGGAAKFQINSKNKGIFVEIPISVISTYYAEKLVQLPEIQRIINIGNNKGLIIDSEDIAATILYHELGHNFGATDQRYNSNLIQNYGNHCNKISCVMSQNNDPFLGWLNKTKQRLLREESKLSPYCPDCEDSMKKKQFLRYKN